MEITFESVSKQYKSKYADKGFINIGHKVFERSQSTDINVCINITQGSPPTTVDLLELISGNDPMM